jgi:hypothetical protein
MITFPIEDTFPLGDKPQDHSIIKEHWGYEEETPLMFHGKPVRILPEGHIPLDLSQIPLDEEARYKCKMCEGKFTSRVDYDEHECRWKQDEDFR